jgi:hypothetical protein
MLLEPVRCESLYVHTFKMQLIITYLCALSSRSFNSDKQNIIDFHSVSVFILPAVNNIRRNEQMGMDIFLSD